MFKFTRRQPRSARTRQSLRQAVGPVPTFFGPSAGGWIERLEDRRLLAAPEGAITDADMQSLTYLGAWSEEIADLTGLEHAANLQVSGLAQVPVEVTIPDPTLEAAIRDSLGKPAGQITDADMASLEWLYVWGDEYGPPLTDLTGLEYAVNLSELDIVSQQVTDLGPLAGLISLEYLYLSGNRITDITPLLGLDNLGSVRLYYNYLDLTPGSEDMQVIEQMQDIAWGVYYEPQSSVRVTDDTDDPYDLQTVVPAWDVNDLGEPATFWIRSGSQLDVTNLTLGGADAGQFVITGIDEWGDPVEGGSFTVPAWVTCGIQVRLAATSVGDKFASITFNTSDPNFAQFELHISGTAELPTPVYFPDANLDAAVRERLGLTAGPVSVRKMSRLHGLDAAGRGISDLTGLEHAINMDGRLNLADNQISDISVLAGMPSLDWLDLSGNRISDLSVFSSVTNFQTLQLFSRKIGSLSILNDMNTTYGLGIRPETLGDLADAASEFGNLALPPEQVADLLAMMSRIINLPALLDFCGLAADPAALAQASAAFGMGLTASQIDGMVVVLEQLDAVGTSSYFSLSKLDDLGKALAAPGNMTSLLLFCEKFGNEGVLSAINVAGSLGLSEDEIQGAASGMQALAALAPNEQLLSDIASLLARLINPWNIAGGNEDMLTSVEGLSAINARYSLGLSPAELGSLSNTLSRLTNAGGDNLVADVARAFSPFFGMMRLDLSWNPITDISDLAALADLEHLSLAGNRIDDFSPLFGLRGLEDLNLEKTGFTDIASLASLPGLYDLILEGNGITDISTLVHLRNLRYLDLESNRISDISVIPSLNGLWYLQLSDNQITDLSAFAGAAKAQALQAFSAAAGTVPILTDLNAAYGLGLDAADINDLAALMSGLGALALPPEQLAGLVSAMSRIVNLPQVLSYLSAAGNPLILATLNFQYKLGLTFSQRSGISAVFTQLSAVTVSDRLFADIGTILAKPGYMASLFLAFQKFGRADLIMGVSGMAGEEITAEDAAELADAMQQIAALKPHEALFVQLAGVMSRITNPQKVFNFFAGISPVAILDGINSAYAMGLSPLQISLASSALADLGQLDITNRILADMGDALTVLPELYELELDNNPLTDISALAGLSSLEWLDVTHNLLDITPGSGAMQVIDGFLADGVTVEYRPQLVLVPSTAGPDAYYAVQGAAGAELYAGSAPGGALVRSLPLGVDPPYVIRLHAGDGPDTLTFDASAGVAAAWLFEFDGGPDSDTLRLVGTDGLSMQVAEEDVSFDGVHWLGFRSVESILLDSLHLNELSLFDEGWLPLAPGGRMFSVQSLTIDHTSALDIADNSLTIAADDTNRAARLSAIQQAIFAARNGEAGIFSSSAAASEHVVAALDAGGYIVIRLALIGDVTLDDQLDGDDYFALDVAFLASGSGALSKPAADLNSDGAIDGGDFFLLDQSFLLNPTPAMPLAARPAQISPFSTSSIVDEVLAEEGVAPVFE